MMKTLRSIKVILVLGLVAAAQSTLAAEEAGQKAVLVTGASSGIGLRITETLAASGFYVYAGARKVADQRRLDAMENVSSVRLDVTIQSDIDGAVEFVRSEGRGLWGIVNNAGVVVPSPLATGPFDDVEFTFDVNVFGPVRINKAFLPLVLESSGRTITIGSINGFVASTDDGGYSASKFAMEGYTDSLAAELAGTGVHVSIVDPGTYKSEIRGKMVAQLLESADVGVIELTDAERADIVKNKFGNENLPEPDDVAKAVLHALSSDTPRRRYMVTPNDEQALMTIRAGLQRLLELNGDHAYTLDRDELVALLDELSSE